MHGDQPGTTRDAITVPFERHGQRSYSAWDAVRAVVDAAVAPCLFLQTEPHGNHPRFNAVVSVQLAFG